MKILMVNNYHYARGGAETVMFEETEALRRCGHDVATYSTRHPRNAPSQLEAYFPSVPLLGEMSLAEKTRHAPRLVSNSDVRRSFLGALDAFQPDVVHFHNIYGRLTPVVVEASRERGIPSVLTAHDYKLLCSSYLRLNEGKPCSSCSYGYYLPALWRRCHKGSRLYSILYGIESTINALKGRYDGVSAFVCPSRFMLESFALKGISRSRLRLLPNFVSIGPGPEKPPGRYLLYAGRLASEKGVPTLLEAMDGLDVTLKIAGDGPEGPRLREIVAGSALRSRVQFVGHCDRDALRQLISGALFTIVPSEWFENAPMAVLESFALGKPVVGADIGGIPELVLDGRTGVLFPPGDAARLRAAIDGLLGSPVRRAEMGMAARALVRERFSSEAHVRGLVAIYEEARA